MQEKVAVRVLCKAHQPSLCNRGWFTTAENRNGWAGCISSHQQISVKSHRQWYSKWEGATDGRPDLGAFQLFKTVKSKSGT